MGNHEHLEGLKGIIELPYFENAGIMSHRPLNQYRVADSTSTYQYYNASVPALTPIDRWDEYQRGYQSYRFAFENNRDTVDIYNVGGTNVSAYRLELPVAAENSSTRRVLIGNPLMCHIDFDKIYALNSGVIEDHYMITDGATQQFLNYRVNGVANELTKQIPPLQGFIITLVDSPSANYLLLPFEGSNAVITPSSDGSALPKPRQVGSETADVSTGWINISAITPPKTGLLQTTDSVVTRATLLINYDLNNIPKVVFPEGLTSKAEVYLIDNDGYLNTEQTENTEPEVVKFGLETGYKGNITFRFNKNNDVIDRVYLVDKALNVTKDISVGGDYIFQQRETSNGLDNDRFELRLTYKKSSIDTQTENTIIAYADHKKLVVQSNENIDKVTLHNSIGNTMFTASAINSTHFTQDLSLVPGVYVIIVELNNGFKQTQKLIIK